MAAPSAFVLLDLQQEYLARLKWFLAERQGVTEAGLPVGNGVLIEQDDVLAMVGMETHKHLSRVDNGHHYCGSSELNASLTDEASLSHSEHTRLAILVVPLQMRSRSKKKSCLIADRVPDPKTKNRSKKVDALSS